MKRIINPILRVALVLMAIMPSVAHSQDVNSALSSYERPQETAIEADLNKPYTSENVSFVNGDVTLAGTLTLPKEGHHFPAVVLVAGTGPQDRDENIFGHKPFLLLADALSRNGFAVLRYDKRGIGSSTAGSPDDTSVQLAEDAMAAVRYLQTRPEVDAAQIGIVGHSEGGSIAVMNAAAHPEEVAFIVSMAGPGINGIDMLVEQNRLILLTQGIEATDQMLQPVRDLYTMVATADDITALRENLSAMMMRESDINTACSPAYRRLLQYDPTENLKLVRCPMFAINGTLDCQVACDENLDAIARLVPHATVRKYEGLNHLFQTCDDWVGSLDYADIQETMNPQVMNDVVAWLKSVAKN